jgi:transcriptional regulator with XRE-family HTH domain
MGRTPIPPPSKGETPKSAPTVNKAVRDLRKHTGLSQQRFSTLLGLSISALQNYENDQKPEPRALLRFWALARDGGFRDLEDTFTRSAMVALSMPGWTVTLEIKKTHSVLSNPVMPDIRWPGPSQEHSA